MTADLTFEPCVRCGGTGKQPSDDAKTGAALARYRAAAGLSLRDLEQAVGLSRAYLSMLEHGIKPWTVALMQRYLLGCQKGGTILDRIVPKPKGDN